MNYYRLFPGLDFPKKSILKPLRLTTALQHLVSDVHLHTLKLIDQAIRYMRIDLQIKDIDIAPAEIIREAIPLALKMQQLKYRYETESVLAMIRSFKMIAEFDQEFIPTPWSDEELLAAVSDSGTAFKSPETEFIVKDVIDQVSSCELPDKISEEANAIDTHNVVMCDFQCADDYNTIDGDLIVEDIDIALDEDVQWNDPQNNCAIDPSPNIRSESEDVSCTNTDGWRQAINNLRTKSIPLVIYAPPYSGKTFCKAMLEHAGLTVHDTDDIQEWRSKPVIVLTNIPQVLCAGINSMSIIPDELAFVSRCRRRNLHPKRLWYSKALYYSLKAKFIVRTRDSVWKTLMEFEDPLSLIKDVRSCAEALIS